jgi:Zn finger protein HypA/HybF involved in hydrogenase expression
MRNHLIIRTLGAVAATLLFWGCSSGNSGAPAQNPTAGTHPANWVNTHWSDATSNPASCVQCHGSATIQASSGGISGQTCFACHHLNGPEHPTGWKDRAQHGRLGAQAKYDVAFTMQGFADCTPCHGTDYNTTLSSNVPSCYTCHTKAPHPNAPWGVGNAASLAATQSSHDQTDPSNAAQCFTCHQNNSVINQGLKMPVLTPAAGAEPGCFNSTMCHGSAVS